MKIRRVFLIIFALFLLGTALFRMAMLAGHGGQTLREEALRISEVHGELSAIRGRILDAAGNPLVWSVRRYDLAVKTDWNGPADEVRRLVQSFFGPNWGNLAEMQPGNVIKYDLTVSELEKADELCRKTRALEVNLAWERVYSENADWEVIGKVRQEHGMEVGISGLEAEYESTLRGTPGVFQVMTDREGRWLDATFRIIREPEAGTDLVLEESISEEMAP